MAATIPNLWPDIRVDAIPPVTILRAQANKLGELTQGIVEAEVTTVTGPDDFVVHRLDLIAPALDGRQARVLTATHRTDYYPIVLEAECFRPKTRKVNLLPITVMNEMIERVESITWPAADDWRPAVGDQNEFIKRLGEVLRSREVRSVIESMIALSNQKSMKGEGATQGSALDGRGGTEAPESSGP